MAGKKTTKKKAKTPKGSKDDKINEETRQIKQAYLASSKQFLTEPISALLKTFDTSLTESKPIDNIVIHSMLIKSSDISAIGISFKGYERLVGTCIWYSIVHSNVLQSIVTYAINQTSLRNLQLIGCNLKEGDSKVLAALVAVSTSIRNLELDHNPLGSGVWNIINETPKGTIKRITFKFCEIEMTDMAKVDAALRISSVSELDLSDNNLGDGGFVAICRRVAQNTSLERLLLASNNITDKSPTGIFPTEIMSLSFCSSNLQFLDLQRNFIKEDGCLRILDLMKERTLVSKIPLVIAVSERISTPVFQQIMGKSKGGKGKKSKKRGKNI